MKKNAIGRARNTHGGDEKYIKIVVEKLEGRDYFLNSGRRIILKLILKLVFEVRIGMN